MEATFDDFEYEEEQEIRANPRAETKPAVKYRIGFFGTVFLVGLAIIFDIAELILTLFSAGAGSYIKDFSSFIVFPVLLWLFKIPFWKGNKKVQKIVTIVVGAIVALIPYLSDILPELAISVFITIMYSRAEDRLGIQGSILQRNPKVITAKRVRPKIRRS